MRNKCEANHVMKPEGMYYYVCHVLKDLTQHCAINSILHKTNGSKKLFIENFILIKK